MQKRNLVLIGFMGCGKTTIGKNLSKLTDYNFIDMDFEIEKRAGMKISGIFEKYGEQEFRNMESALCAELSNADGCIIATGGGVVKSDSNIEMLKRNGTVLYIKASPEQIYRNLKKDKSRPLLNVDNKMQRIIELMEERKPLYDKRSDITVEITGLNSQEAAKIIKDILERKNML